MCSKHLSTHQILVCQQNKTNRDSQEKWHLHNQELHKTTAKGNMTMQTDITFIVELYIHSESWVWWSSWFLDHPWGPWAWIHRCSLRIDQYSTDSKRSLTTHTIIFLVIPSTIYCTRDRLPVRTATWSKVLLSFEGSTGQWLSMSNLVPSNQLLAVAI